MKKLLLGLVLINIVYSIYLDAWYELHNPDQSDLPMNVSWQTLRSDYPPNLENLRIQQIVLLFVGGNIS